MTSVELSLRDAAWLGDSALRSLLRALGEARGDARVVGGAVRDALAVSLLSDAQPDERDETNLIDIAVSHPPDEVARRVEKIGGKTIPTGVDHGSVTVVLRGRLFEVTTLRVDVETFGRRARVAWSDDWTADARRRDFTINALYCDSRGVVFDPLGAGLEDLRRRRVRFIGDPAERLREDYLRLLRFFRFRAAYGRFRPHGASLRACADAADGLARVSRERIGGEMRRLLVGRYAPRALAEMIETDVLRVAVGDRIADVADPEALSRLRESGDDVDPMLALAALTRSSDGDAAEFPLEEARERLRLSNEEFGRFSSSARASKVRLAGGESDAERLALARKLLYRHGRHTALDVVRLSRSGEAKRRSRRLCLSYGRLAADVRSEAIPTFPLRGRHLLEWGFDEGVELGTILRAAEKRWIEDDFRGDLSDLKRRILGRRAA